MKTERIDRSLTNGEGSLARAIFGDALDLSRVRIHNRAYLPGQGKGVAMTPDGELWFRPEDYLTDFSITVGNAAWMIHELTHAWQYQTGRSLRLRGLVEQVGRVFGRDPYAYGELDPNRSFASYMNEQQATIVEDYFRLRQHHPPAHGTGALDDYRRVIPFVADRD